MIVKLQGGLGNQIFEVLFGLSVAYKRQEEVFFDKSSFDTDPLRHYELDAYDLNIQFHEGHHRGPVFREGDIVFNPGVYAVQPNTYFEGYWQVESYFEPELAYNLFRIPKGYPNGNCLAIARRIQGAKDTCFIGVRRADYQWPERINLHGVMPMDYYRKAMEMFPLRTKFFIFTDDPEWCRENFRDEIVEVNGPDEKHWDIWLGSLCQNAIIPNSTFSWWQAWLGADRRGGKVIAPEKWFANGMPNEIVPERWTKL